MGIFVGKTKLKTAGVFFFLGGGGENLKIKHHSFERKIL